MEAAVRLRPTTRTLFFRLEQTCAIFDGALETRSSRRIMTLIACDYSNGRKVRWRIRTVGHSCPSGSGQGARGVAILGLRQAPIVFIALWISAAAVGGGAGSFLGWMSLEVRSARETVVSAVILLLGGLAGAWGGCYFEAIGPENPDPFVGRAVSSAALLWSTLVPNLGATAFGVLNGIRTGWMCAGG